MKNTRDDKLIIDNMGLVYYIVNKMNIISREDRQDAESEGFLGLIKAVDAYDSSKNVKFATFANRVIYNQIAMYLRSPNKHRAVVSLECVVCNDGDDVVRLGDVLESDMRVEEDIVGQISADELIAATKEIAKPLTCNQQNIINLILRGNSQEEIAYELCLSQSYVSRVLVSVRKAAKITVATGRVGNIKTK